MTGHTTFNQNPFAAAATTQGSPDPFQNLNIIAQRLRAGGKAGEITALQNALSQQRLGLQGQESTNELLKAAIGRIGSGIAPQVLAGVGGAGQSIDPNVLAAISSQSRLQGGANLQQTRAEAIRTQNIGGNQLRFDPLTGAASTVFGINEPEAIRVEQAKAQIVQPGEGKLVKVLTDPVTGRRSKLTTTTPIIGAPPTGPTIPIPGEKGAVELKIPPGFDEAPNRELETHVNSKVSPPVTFTILLVVDRQTNQIRKAAFREDGTFVDFIN